MQSSTLLEIIHEWSPRLAACSIPDADVVVGSKWTRKEILGHLFDSAVNNQQRFIRLQQGDLEDFPGYDQDHWVVAGCYRQANWTDLQSLWQLLNRQIALIINNIEPTSEGNVWKAKGQNLSFLVHDYTCHMIHHLQNMRLENQKP